MRLFTSLALITIAYVALSRVNKVHTTRFYAKLVAKFEEVQTWEGEGGGLFTGGLGFGVKVVSVAVIDLDLAYGGT